MEINIPADDYEVIDNDPLPQAQPEMAGVAADLRTALEHYGIPVSRDPAQLRDFITNRLIVEAMGDDARTRLKALELLGRRVDLGFGGGIKTAINVNVSDTTSLQTQLKEKLSQIMGASSLQTPTALKQLIPAEYDSEQLYD
jgi:hypothetical protein